MIVKLPKHQIMAAEELERGLELTMEDYISEFIIDVRNINQENNKYRVSILKKTSFIDDFVYAEIILDSTQIGI